MANPNCFRILFKISLFEIAAGTIGYLVFQELFFITIPFQFATLVQQLKLSCAVVKKHLLYSMIKYFLSIGFFLLASTHTVKSQNQNTADQFWTNLQALCGNAYEGTLVAGATANDPFTGKKLVMHVRACSDSTIRIPFFVGEDKSRTWVLIKKKNAITLKHDHRHEDGSEDKITQYGGTTPNTGSASLQYFPADQHTCNLIPAAATNVWLITIDDKTLTYNLRRIGTDRLFTVSFDLTKKVEVPTVPWGWTD